MLVNYVVPANYGSVNLISITSLRQANLHIKYLGKSGLTCPDVIDLHWQMYLKHMLKYR